MPQDKIYKNWKAVTEADFVSLFIKTWFAYISTLRTMFPEAANKRGDGKYLNAYKDNYRTIGSKKLVVDDQIMAAMEQVYREGRKIIMKQYPEYYLWDFYRVNEDFEYTFKDVPPNKSDCLIIGLKVNRNRGTKWQFIVSGFARFFGKHYEEYNGNVQFRCNISGILESSTGHIKENPTESEQDYLSWLLREINVALTRSIVEAFKLHYQPKSLVYYVNTDQAKFKASMFYGSEYHAKIRFCIHPYKQKETPSDESVSCLVSSITAKMSSVFCAALASYLPCCATMF